MVPEQGIALPNGPLQIGLICAGGHSQLSCDVIEQAPALAGAALGQLQVVRQEGDTTETGAELRVAGRPLPIEQHTAAGRA